MFRHGLKFKNFFRVDHMRKGILIGRIWVPNGVTNEGKDDMLGVQFDAVTQKPNWYIGLIDNSGFSALDPTDTLASHAGWTENTDYDEVNRVEWNPDAPASQAITNATPRDFTMNASVTINGVLIASVNTGTSGILWATGSFTGGAIPVADDDVLSIVYTVELQDP